MGGGAAAARGGRGAGVVVAPGAAGPGHDPGPPGAWRRWLRRLPALLGVVLLAGAVFVVQREFRHLRVADIRLALAAIPGRSLGWAALWTVLSYGVLTFYDRLATIYAGHRVAFRRTAFASFCAYALAHNLGFAALSGAAVRYRLYAHWGLSPVQIAKVVAFCSLTFGLGGLVLGGAILVGEPGVVPLLGRLLPHWAMWAAGGLMWAVVVGYVALAKVLGTVRMRGHEVVLPGARMALVQVSLATVDVAVTAAILYALLPEAGRPDYIVFLAIYVSSYTAGLAANVPGGLGVFDTAILLGLAPYMPASVALGAVVVFRLYYYVIPLFLAGSMFAGNELVLRGRAMVAARGGLPVGEALAAEALAGGGAGAGADAGRAVAARAEAAVRWSEPDFAAAAATGVVALCGALLLSLGVIDSRPDFTWINPDFAGLATNAGQYVPSLLGAALLVFSLALSRRVTLAWGGAIVLLLAAAAFTASQGEPLWVPGVLVLAVLLVAPFRDAYYRHARVLGGAWRGDAGEGRDGAGGGPGAGTPGAGTPGTGTPGAGTSGAGGRGVGGQGAGRRGGVAHGVAVVLPGLVLAAGVAALALLEPQVRFVAQNSWWEIVASPELPGRLRVAVGVAVGVAMLAGWALLRPGDVGFVAWDEAARERLRALGGVAAGEADGLVLGEAGRSAVAFRRTGHVLLALGDPSGADSDRVSAVWRLRDLAQQEGRDLAVWGAGTGLLAVYGALGLAPLPLGEDGMVCDAAGAARSGAWSGRALYCVAGRDLDELLPLLPELAGAGTDGPGGSGGHRVAGGAS
ncbi:MAG: phosphatidylglycerol lysyltransferase domain-containing protein [Janthinobacterium lividum]